MDNLQPERVNGTVVIVLTRGKGYLFDTNSANVKRTVDFVNDKNVIWKMPAGTHILKLLLIKIPVIDLVNEYNNGVFESGAILWS